MTSTIGKEPFSPLNDDREDIEDKLNESDEHLEKKRQKAIQLWMKGWTVYIEHTIRNGRVVDVYAVKDGEAKIVEIGSIESEKEEELKELEEEYVNIPYQKDGKIIEGQANYEGQGVSKSISFSDKGYFKLVETQPDNANFSEWVETLAREGLQARIDSGTIDDSNQGAN